MKKIICILASAALFGGCEQKTEVVAPAASPVPEAKTDKAVDPNTFSRTKKPRLSSETKTDTTTTTISSPTP